jgi:hypothetical protein
LRLKDPAMEVSLLGEKKVRDDAALLGDRVAICIGLARKDGNDLLLLGPDLIGRGKVKEVNLYFDKDNGLLLKEECRDQGSKVELFYSDYKRVNGIPVAQKIVRRMDGGVNYRSEVEVSIVDKLNTKLFQES